MAAAENEPPAGLRAGHRPPHVRAHLLRRAADQIPGNAEIGYHYARALAATDNKTEAREVLRKALDSGQRFQGIDKAQDLMRELDRE